MYSNCDDFVLFKELNVLEDGYSSAISSLCDNTGACTQDRIQLAAANSPVIGLSRRRAGRGRGCRDLGGDVAGRDVVLQVGLDRLKAPDDGVEPCDVELLGGVAQLGDRL